MVSATLLQAAVLWAWHTPALYRAALAHPAVHLAEHATLLAAGVAFWTAVLATATRRRRQQGLATLCLGLTIAQGGVLGALITFAGGALFGALHGGWGLGVLEDQRLAGCGADQRTGHGQSYRVRTTASRTCPRHARRRTPPW